LAEELGASVWSPWHPEGGFCFPHVVKEDAADEGRRNEEVHLSSSKIV
jgi:hypothetical protein